MTPCPARPVADDGGGGGGDAEVFSIGGADVDGTRDEACPVALLGDETLVEGLAPAFMVDSSLDNFCRLGEGAAMEGDGERVRPRVDMIKTPREFQAAGSLVRLKSQEDTAPDPSRGKRGGKRFARPFGSRKKWSVSST